MFDGSLPEPGQLAGLPDAALIDALSGWAAASAAAEARRLAAVAELVARRMRDPEHADWMADDWDAVAAEIGAALNVSPGRAGGDMELALTLRDRLPQVAAAFAAGMVSARSVATISRRSELVCDREALAVLDAALAERISTYGSLSQRKLEAAVDVWITAVDPDAVRRTRTGARGREVIVGDPDDRDGITGVFARLMATDAKLLDLRLSAMAKAVCENDPRTVAQRRADALGALAAGSAHLACACGGPACPATASDGRSSAVVVHVYAEADTVAEAQPDPYRHGEDRPGGAADPTAMPATRRAAVIAGGSIVPAPLLAELINGGAKVRHLVRPAADPHPRYRPTRAQDEWVRARDLTCRAPGCDRAATHTDIDHTVPWPAGVTHPSNTKLYCRLHHLIKTFWTGFSDRQHPDGMLEWTTPTGHTYVTRPLSAVLFPTVDTMSAKLPCSPSGLSQNPARGLKMPKRKRTRAKERKYRIDAERALNAVENPLAPF
jgi:hypothetical protein